MATSRYNESVNYFNGWLKEATQKSLEDLTLPRRQDRTLCICCRLVLQKASFFFCPEPLERPHDLVTFKHYSEFEFLVESSRTCSLCYLLMYSLKHERGDLRMPGPDATYSNGLLELSALRRHNKMPTPMEIWFSDDGSSDEVVLDNSRQLQIICGEADKARWDGTSIHWASAADIMRLPLVKAYYVEAQPTTQIALNWIRYCDENHSVCSKYRNVGEGCVLPSRVIDVGASNSLSEPYLFISNGQRAPYVCLSHCWGSPTSDLIKTTKADMTKWMKEIPLAALPKTFADAVKITRDINLRYLWIDSLCIIQDDVDDWQKEAAAMASIYKNSHVTIAATASKDSSGGCFRSRKPFVLLRRPVLDPAQSSNTPGTCIFYPESRRTLEYITNSPLSKRGWAFQEEMLSCRTLNFCEDQLLWHCLERTVTEDGVVDFSGYHEMGSENRLMKTKIGFAAELEDLASQRLHWWNIVKEFSSRKLTLLTDRLPALAGIISEYQKRTRDEPIAGLWKSDIPYGLLWRPASRSMRSPPELRRIPSWSWLALDGPIQRNLVAVLFGEERRVSIQSMVDVIAAEVYHESLPTTSPIVGGLLTLFGKLQYATRSLEEKVAATYTETTDRDMTIFRILSDLPHTSGVGGFQGPWSFDEPNRHLGWCTFDQEPPAPDQLIWCLEISVSERQSEMSIDPFEDVRPPARTHDVLILRPPEHVDGPCRRIGVGVIHSNRGAFWGARRRINIV